LASVRRIVRPEAVAVEGTAVAVTLLTSPLPLPPPQSFKKSAKPVSNTTLTNADLNILISSSSIILLGQLTIYLSLDLLANDIHQPASLSKSSFYIL
jgi:hypothetical protein